MKYNGSCEQRELMMELSKVSFAITEMNLYLDTHPYDMDAIEQCNRYLNKKRQLEHEYCAKYGPICMDDVTGAGKEWSWAMEPAPWERGY